MCRLVALRHLIGVVLQATLMRAGSSLACLVAGLCLALVMADAARARSSAPVVTDHVSARLIAERNVTAPGDRFWVALRLEMRPGWHTYWVNPGDSGLATTIAWTLPDGVKASPIVWPAPTRFPVGPLMNYGYDNRVLLLVEITVPSDAGVDTMLELAAEANWLVCEQICVPEDGRFTLALPVKAVAASASDDLRGEIEQARDGLPKRLPWHASASLHAGKATIRIEDLPLRRESISDAYFFSDASNLVRHAALQRLGLRAGGLVLEIPTEAKVETSVSAFSGVLEIRERLASGDAVHAFAVSLVPTIGAAAHLDDPGLAQAIAFALLGGLILNLMPCVFPVLAMKALALLGARDQPRRTARLHGLAYTLGVLGTFAALGVLLLALRAAGMELGWGFQLQSPIIVLLLAYLLLAVGLNLSGVFAVRMAALPGMPPRDSYVGSFGSGALAVFVAAPCTAPFMAAALGFAFAAPAPATLAVLLALGLGLALPFLVVSFAPSLARVLPRPGAWMETLRGVLAFPVYGAAAWLVWVLAQQAGADGAGLALAGGVLIGLAAWIFGQTQREAHSRLWRGATIACVVGALGLAALLRETDAPRGDPAAAATNEAMPSAAFSPDALARLRREGRAVFVNMTAAWCLSCIVNERGALASPAVRAAFAAGGVVYVKGDWTRRDAAITAFLRGFGHAGVPLYVFYPTGANSTPVVLPQLLTEAIILRTIGGAK
jgi:thiol:disulfide interchange protein DsbD